MNLEMHTAEIGIQESVSDILKGSYIARLAGNKHYITGYIFHAACPSMSPTWEMSGVSFRCQLDEGHEGLHEFEVTWEDADG